MLTGFGASGEPALPAELSKKRGFAFAPAPSPHRQSSPRHDHLAEPAQGFAERPQKCLARPVASACATRAGSQARWVKSLRPERFFRRRRAGYSARRRSIAAGLAAERRQKRCEAAVVRDRFLHVVATASPPSAARSRGPRCVRQEIDRVCRGPPTLVPGPESTAKTGPAAAVRQGSSMRASWPGTRHIPWIKPKRRRTPRAHSFVEAMIKVPALGARQKTHRRGCRVPEAAEPQRRARVSRHYSATESPARPLWRARC